MLCEKPPGYAKLPEVVHVIGKWEEKQQVDYPRKQQGPIRSQIILPSISPLSSRICPGAVRGPE